MGDSRGGGRENKKLSLDHLLIPEKHKRAPNGQNQNNLSKKVNKDTETVTQRIK